MMRISLALLVTVAFVLLIGVDAARLQDRLSTRPSSAAGALVEQTSETHVSSPWEAPKPVVSTCGKGPYTISNMSIKSLATQTITLAKCTGDRVQAAIASLTVAVADKRSVKVDTQINGQHIDIYSQSTGSCFQKPQGLATLPANGSGSVKMLLTCLDKSKPCVVSFGYSASCVDVSDEDDE